MCHLYTERVSLHAALHKTSWSPEKIFIILTPVLDTAFRKPLICVWPYLFWGALLLKVSRIIQRQSCDVLPPFVDDSGVLRHLPALTQICLFLFWPDVWNVKISVFTFVGSVDSSAPCCLSQQFLKWCRSFNKTSVYLVWLQVNKCAPKSLLSPFSRRSLNPFSQLDKEMLLWFLQKEVAGVKIPNENTQLYFEPNWKSKTALQSQGQ